MRHFCPKTSINKMEKLQYGAIRLAFNDFTSSYEALLDKVNMSILHIKLVGLDLSRLKLSNLYTNHHRSTYKTLYSIKFSLFFQVRKSSQCTSQVVYAQQDFGKLSFSYEAAGLWNSLPNELRISVRSKTLVSSGG